MLVVVPVIAVSETGRLAELLLDTSGEGYRQVYVRSSVFERQKNRTGFDKQVGCQYNGSSSSMIMPLPSHVQCSAAGAFVEPKRRLFDDFSSRASL
jgi:hypothetical protein